MKSHDAFVPKQPIPGMSKWVLTVLTEDEGEVFPIHIEDRSKAMLEELLAAVRKQLPPGPADGEWWIEEVPVTWECDGRDNCRQQA